MKAVRCSSGWTAIGNSLKKYSHQYIAYNAKKIIASGKNLQEVLNLAEGSGDILSIYLVPKFTGLIFFPRDEDLKW